MSVSSSPYNFRVDIRTQYVSEQSSPEHNRYVFAYTITIHNTGTQSAKLVSRRWRITDGHGKIHEVSSQVSTTKRPPYLRPGEGFQSTEAALITTPVAILQGSYQMLTDEGYSFNAEIPPFSLSLPHTLH